MKFKEKVGLSGKITVELRSLRGELIEKRVIKNLIVTVGKQALADALLGSSTYTVTHCAVGTDGTAPNAADTALKAELDRNAVTYSNRSGGTAVFETFFSASEAVGSIKEAGLFNQASGGTMLCRGTFPAVNKTSTLTMTVKYEVEFT